jgi:glycosyltransferase involved in cell wall biosynthesis
MLPNVNWSEECAVAIPCLNEAAAIGSLIAEVREQLASIIVVDDGSTDDTARLAAKAGAHVLCHRQSQGKGAALNTGWNEARARGFAWVLCMDGDGQHSSADIGAFLSSAETTGAKLIVGNRMANPDGMPWLRRQVNRWMSRRLERLAGCALPDSQCGFRLMHLGAWSELTVKARHFEIESEVLLAFAEAGHRIEFVPIRVIYKDEASKIHPVRDTARWFRWWIGRKRLAAPQTRAPGSLF